MTDFSNKTFRELSFPFFREAFIILDMVFQEMGIFYYLIGAQARDIHLLDQGIAPSRGTQDIDFAVMLPDMEHYEALISELEKHGFERVSEPYRMIFRPAITVIDLLPFGEIEEMSTVRFTERDIEISVIGFREVGEGALDYPVENLTIRISPLEGLTILKLLSWRDKHERTKDLHDFGVILTHYFEMNVLRFFKACEENQVELDDFGYDFMLEAGAYLLGCDMAFLLRKAPELTQDIISIFLDEMKETPGGISNYLINNGFISDYNTLDKVFSQIIRGMKKSFN
ncbi:MAG: nucleotidyl transferase AbiEii/AbiGii toxin family protein [Bacteroidetes bacterium]|nr:nucleotidyl transferase AbiEii/AbiGii toxin family protein [Bacteroidota bacterium]